MTGACWTATTREWPLISVRLAHSRREHGASPGARTGELSSLLLSALLLRIEPAAAFAKPRTTPSCASGAPQKMPSASLTYEETRVQAQPVHLRPAHSSHQQTVRGTEVPRD
jgi:hypothetical protein